MWSAYARALQLLHAFLRTVSDLRTGEVVCMAMSSCHSAILLSGEKFPVTRRFVGQDVG